MAKERILVVVKTYPTLSRKYGELVCTAGIREDGSWVRIHPVPLERPDDEERYSKFDWIELDLAKSRKDRRPETYNPVDLEGIRVIGHVDDWKERRRLVLESPKAKVHRQLQPLYDGAKGNTLSLALFKPKRERIHELLWQACEREWNAAKVAVLRNDAAQGRLLDNEHWRQTFKLIRKLPYDFCYRFKDADRRESKMRVLDWDLGRFYWFCARDNQESFACSGVWKRYFDEFRRTDLHFVLGTIHRFHTWVIVGVLPFPSESQMDRSLPPPNASVCY